jgi:hypothetical protein
VLDSSAYEALLQRITDRIKASDRICAASRAILTSNTELIALSRETIARSRAILQR